MSNTTLLHLQERAAQAAKQQLAGDKNHGTAGLLAIATLIEGVRSGLFVERVEHNGKPVVMTFTVNHAIDCARLMYNRFAKECETSAPLVDYFKTRGRVISTEEGMKDWRDYIVGLLVPYVYGPNAHEPRTTSTKLRSSYKGTPKEVAVLKVIEDTKYRRKVLTDAWPYAMLHIARDMSGDLWMQSKVDTKDANFGLFIMASDFLPEGVDLVAKSDRPALCKPLKGASVIISGNTVDPTTGGDKAFSVNASVGQFGKAWRTVEQSDNTDWLATFNKISSQIDRDWTLPSNAQAAFLAAFNAMATYKTEVLDAAAVRNNKGPAPTSSSPEDDAHTIANREAVTLRNGAQG